MGNLNKDLITKLAKLANNNPNEHEANSAARRVCKLLAEANFDFSHAPASKKWDYEKAAAEKRARTWADVKRSSEPEFRSRPYTGAGFDWDIFNDFYDDLNRGRRRPANPHSQRNRTAEYYEAEKKADENRKAQQRQREERERRTSQNRTCTKCGHTFPTYNTDTPYICTICQYSMNNPL